MVARKKNEDGALKKPTDPESAPWLRMWQARPRLVPAVLLGLAVAWLLPETAPLHGQSHWLIGWNAGSGLYLGLALQMMRSTDTEGIRRRAVRRGEGRMVILTLVILAAVAVLLAGCARRHRAPNTMHTISTSRGITTRPTLAASISFTLRASLAHRVRPPPWRYRGRHCAVLVWCIAFWCFSSTRP